MAEQRRRVPLRTASGSGMLRANGFEILDLIEVQAPARAETHEHYDYVTAEWGRKWPAKRYGERAGANRPPSLDVAAPAEILGQLRIPSWVVAALRTEEGDPVAHTLGTDCSVLAEADGCLLCVPRSGNLELLCRRVMC